MKKFFTLTFLATFLALASFAFDITGVSTGCVGSTYYFYGSDSAVGTWSSSNTAIATVSSSGNVTALSAGNTTITFTTSGGSYTAPFTASLQPGPITESLVNFCAGGTSICTDTSAGGTWSTGSSTILTINTSGVVTAASEGHESIIYTLPGGCYSSISDTISSTIPDTITGPSYIIAGNTTAISYSGYSGMGGTWSSSNLTVGTINSDGIFTALSAGFTNITYTDVAGCWAVPPILSIMVTPLDVISGNMNFSSFGFYAEMKLWLITYNTTTLELEAIDSTTVSGFGPNIYYQFTGEPTDSFRIKAATVLPDTAYSGPVPTYHTSSLYWHDASVLYHISGTQDLNQNINMIFGTTSTGTGFIGGNVTTGANKGTSGTIPAVGLQIYAINATSGALMQQTYTDASGNYSFSSLPLGSYKIYPEAINYATTAYTDITLTSANPSMAAASFVQHTLSKTITPISESVATLASSATASVVAYPNPAHDKLNLLWNSKMAEKATIQITDIAGREMYHSTLNMTNGNGTNTIDLSGFADGLYIVTVKSASINYTGKVQVQN